MGVWRGGEAAAPAAALTNRARGRNRGEKATHPRLDRLKLFRGIAKQEHGGVLSFKTDAERHGKKGGTQGPQRCLPAQGCFGPGTPTMPKAAGPTQKSHRLFKLSNGALQRD